MPKSRMSKKEFDRVKRQQEYKLQMEQLARLEAIVSSLPDQKALDRFLLQEKDSDKRHKMFDYARRWIKFKNPSCPSEMDGAGWLSRASSGKISPYLGDY